MYLQMKWLNVWDLLQNKWREEWMGTETRLVMISPLSKLGDGYKATRLSVLPNILYKFEIRYVTCLKEEKSSLNKSICF